MTNFKYMRLIFNLRIFSVLVVFGALFAVAAVAYAEEGASDTGSVAETTETQSEVSPSEDQIAPAPTDRFGPPQTTGGKPKQVPVNFREAPPDKKEDIRDTIEDRRDAQVQGGVKDRMEDVRDKMEDVRDKREDIQDTREDRIKAHLRKLGALLLATITRMEALMERIQSRTDKLEADGVDVTDAEGSLAIAQTHLDAAKTDLQSIQATAAFILNAQSLAAASESVNASRTVFQSIRTHLKAAHLVIRRAVEQLKEASVEAGLNTSAAVQNENAQ